MTRSRTTRLNLWRWSSDGDTQSRQDFDDISAELEARVALRAGDTFTGPITIDPGIKSSRLRAAESYVDPNEATTSTSYVDLPTYGPALDVVAPPSGVIVVSFTAGINVSSGRGYATCAIFGPDGGGAPTVAVRAANDAASAEATGDTGTRSRQIVQSGLTPGVTYRVVLMYRTTAGSSAFYRRSLAVTPSL